MKSKRVTLVLVLFAMICVGWIMAFRVVTNVEAIQAQTTLVEQADYFMEKELYVRAIPLYKEALQYDTDDTDSIQAKLLNAYQESDDVANFIALVRERVATKDATENEVLQASEMLLENGLHYLEDALGMVETILGYLDVEEETLQNYLEEHRYTIKTYSTGYEEILPSATGVYAASMEGKWGYINEAGKQILPTDYDYVTNMNEEGYAIVLEGDTYYTILKSGEHYGVDDGTEYAKMTDIKMLTGSRVIGQRDGTYSYFDYDFNPLTTGDLHQYTDMSGTACNVAAVKKDKWGVITHSGEIVVDFIYDDVAINSFGNAFAGNRAMVKEGDTWHLIDAEGNVIGQNTYADAKAPESQGYIAVANDEGKWGFIDAEGNLLIDYQYDDAKSFSDDVAAVNTGVSWGYISKMNKLVIEDTYEELYPFYNGVAIAKQGKTMQFITMPYYNETK